MASPSTTTYANPFIWVNGKLSGKLHDLLESVNITADESGLSTLEAVFHNWGSSKPTEEGYQLFDGTLGLGAGLRIAFAEDEKAEQSKTVFIGVITSIDGIFRSSCAARLRVRAEDNLWPLRLTRHTRVFEEATDAAIVEQIGSATGLKVNADAKGPTHTELLSVNQSDLALMRERARAVDASMGLDHEGLQLQSRRPSAEPPIPLSCTGVPNLEISADLAHQRTEIQVHGWSVADKDGIHAIAGASAIAGEKGPGKTGAEFLEGMSVPAVEHHALEFPSTFAEAETLAAALMAQRARRFVVARGSTDGNPAIKIGAELEIVDVGPWYTGRYKVVTLSHTFQRSGRFETHFVATRPTLGGGL